MSVFVLAMVVGLGGLVLMALPGIRRGHGSVHGGARLHGPKVHAGKLSGQGKLAGHARAGKGGGSHSWIPEPRAILSMLALFGAFGDVARAVLPWSLWADGLVALLPAIAIEALLVGPLWRTALRFQGRPSSPLDGLVLEEALAVTAFRNGRGIVQVVRDGRAVQFAAELAEGELDRTVKPGEKLHVKDVDALRERVVVGRT